MRYLSESVTSSKYFDSYMAKSGAGDRRLLYISVLSQRQRLDCCLLWKCVEVDYSRRYALDNLFSLRSRMSTILYKDIG